MLVRIVRMTFKPEFVEEFKQLFDSKKTLIGSFDGCNKVDLLQDINNPCIFFTISEWQSEAQLNTYRNSNLFEETWTAVKQWFGDKPLAHSIEKVS